MYSAQVDETRTAMFTLDLIQTPDLVIKFIIRQGKKKKVSSCAYCVTSVGVEKKLSLTLHLLHMRWFNVCFSI